MQHPDLYIKQDLKFYWRGIILRRDREKQHPQIKNQKTYHMVIEMSHLVHCTNCFPAAQDMHGASQEAEGSSIRTTSIPPQTQHSLLELSISTLSQAIRHINKTFVPADQLSAHICSKIASYSSTHSLNRRRALFGAQCSFTLVQKTIRYFEKDFTLQWLIKGGREGPPPPSKFFQFHAFLGNFGKIVCWRPPPPPQGSWRPLLGKILDPPLHWYKKNSTNQYPSGKWFYLPVTTTGTVAVLQSSRFADTSSNSSWSPRFLTSVSKSLLYHRRAYLIIYHHQLFNVNISLIRPNIQFNSYMH